MSLLEGIDYTVRYLPFPNCASEALVLSLGDGSYQILLNSRYSEAVLRARLEHELAHLRADHLYQCDRPIAEREAEADGKPCPSPRGEGGAQRRMRGDPAPASTPYRPTGGGYLASWGRAMAWARGQMANSSSTY